MPRVLPSPTLVIGLGRFGLAVLERLGDDWMGLKTSGADASLKNLRLLWVHPGREEDDVLWRQRDRKVAAVACEVGEGDLPSLALDLAILRSLGLVRFRDGVYQVAVPRDAGPVDFDRTADPAAGREAIEPAALRVVRRRYFEWLGLSPDPIIAVERLRRLLERHHELDLFVTPILNRVRQGHSPGVLIAVIGRCRALAGGRDPAPWKWLQDELPDRTDDGVLEIPLDAKWLEDERRMTKDLEGIAPEPLPGWKPGSKPGKEEEGQGEGKPEGLAEAGSDGLTLVVPGPFVPRQADLASPLDPVKFLEIDWETSGWASESTGHLRIRHVEASSFRFGLFDHGAAARGTPSVEMLGPRLEELARLVYQGLVRLWIDLQRERVEDVDPSLKGRLDQEPLDAALRQSLELLGELLVRPLVSGPDAAATASNPAAPVEAFRRSVPELASSPSGFLASAVVERRNLVGQAETALTDRLADFGLATRDGAGEPQVQLLFQQVTLTLADARTDDGRNGAGRSPGLLTLRRVLNDITSQLYSFSFLTEYRHHPTRHPPRLTVFVVGDMGEPFTRVETRDVLREIHAELLRAFSPIFEFYREGFNRCLSIVPILWMPHPSDPFGGAPPAANRSEEAAIIDRVHGIRRWVESVLPPSRRRIAQIFVNGRVTDNAVLSQRDAVRQTRDFISFQARNDIGADDWLRRTATGPGTIDLFSSFSCYEIDFPAERCREYLANRLARICLARIRKGWVGGPGEVAADGFAPGPVEELTREGYAVLERQTSEAGAQMAGEVTGRVDVRPQTTTRELLAAFDEPFERSLKDKIQARWSDLIRRRGRVDEQVDALRRRIADELLQTLSQVQRHGDGLIEEHVGKGGLPAATRGFDLLCTATRDELQRQEEQRQRAADLCRRHGKPSLEPIAGKRREVVAAAERKPEQAPMQFGLLLWALLSVVLGAPLAESVAALLMSRPGLAPFAALLGRLDGLFGGALVFLVAAWLLRLHMHRAVAAVREAIAALAREVGQLFHGTGQPPEQESRSSIRSLFETRLALTGALATRGFALRVFERALADQGLAFRLSRSVDIQALHLNRLAEDLGVRPAAGESESVEPRDDLRHLFATRSGEVVERLTEPGLVDRYFQHKMGPAEEIGPTVARFIEESGGLAEWRRNACLSDTERILAFCRQRFEALVETPIAAQETFAEEAGRRLCTFVACHYPNVGFGAKFIGYEGLDPDGVNVSADASLVLESSLRTLFEQTRKEQARREPVKPGEKVEAVPTAIDVIPAQVRPNAAWLLSLAQGIRAHSVRNLKRFESFHDRVHMPDDRTFPLSQEEQHGLPVNSLSSYGPVGVRLRDEIQKIEARRRDGARSGDE